MKRIKDDLTCDDTMTYVHQISDYCATNACRIVCACLKALKQVIQESSED